MTGGLLIAQLVLLRAQQNLTGNAKICDEFDNEVTFGGKIDEAPKFFTNDFKEHNILLQADGLQAFIEKMKTFRAGGLGAGFGGGRGRGGGPAPARTIEQSSDLVTFYILNPERDDPNNPGKKRPASTRVDVFKMRAGRIAEHWD